MADKEAFDRIGRTPDTLGIILDADDEPVAKRFARFAMLIKDWQFPAPETPEDVAVDGDHRTGIFSFPGNHQQGSIEDLLLPLSKRRFPELQRHAIHYVREWRNASVPDSDNDFEELMKPAGERKATLSAMAALLKPAKPLQATIEDHRWVPTAPRDIPVLIPLMRFLDQLIPSR